jgi:NAD(P)-dependent dehydrogenase (short-subunit alcohol dehydrogenase family)
MRVPLLGNASAARNDLRGKVVVVTGASSGLGREAAAQFAARGCKLVLAARRDEDLQDTADMCRARGGEALVVETDVTREDEVERLARRAVEEHGHIDVWVNNAGVTLFAPLDEASFEEHRRVIETNLYGAMHGARAVVPIFRRQKQGVLINVGSILSKIGQPFVPSYVISKFALRGLSETLRTQLADEPEIHVCSVFPYAIDTPHFQDGANEVGREARAMPPVQSPEKVAAAIVETAEHPRRERHVPRIAVLGLAWHAVMPRTTERLLLRALRKYHFSEEPEPSTRGNLYRPAAGPGAVHGARPPQVGTPAFLVWAAAELAKIQVEDAARTVRRLWTRSPG